MNGTLPLREFLRDLVKNWEYIPIRVLQDGKWQSLYLSEIKDPIVILQWIISTKDRFWR